MEHLRKGNNGRGHPHAGLAFGPHREGQRSLGKCCFREAGRETSLWGIGTSHLGWVLYSAACWKSAHEGGVMGSTCYRTGEAAHRQVLPHATVWEAACRIASGWGIRTTRGCNCCRLLGAEGLGQGMNITGTGGQAPSSPSVPSAPFTGEHPACWQGSNVPVSQQGNEECIWS